MNIHGRKAAVCAMCAALCLVTAATSCSHDNTPKDTVMATGTYSDTAEPSESASDTGAAQSQTVPKPVETQPAEMSGTGAASVYCLRGLPVSSGVQQLALLRCEGGLYAYTVQRKGQTVYLSRLSVDEESGFADVVNGIELNGYGHGESFDISVRDGEVYFYIGSGANSLNSYAWATTITRFKWTDGVFSDKKVIDNIQYASTDGSILFEGATPYRINFALDNASDTMAMFIRADKNRTGKNISCYLSAYRLSEIDRLLDECTGRISFASCASAFLATSGKQPVDEICNNTSFQGMEVDDAGDIFIIGGTDTLRPELSKFSISDTSVKRKRVTRLNWMTSERLGDMNFTTTRDYPEIEALTYFEGKMYCSFNKTVPNITNGFEIFVITEKG